MVSSQPPSHRVNVWGFSEEQMCVRVLVYVHVLDLRSFPPSSLHTWWQSHTCSGSVFTGLFPWKQVSEALCRFLFAFIAKLYPPYIYPCIHYIHVCLCEQDLEIARCRVVNWLWSGFWKSDSLDGRKPCGDCIFQLLRPFWTVFLLFTVNKCTAFTGSPACL